MYWPRSSSVTVLPALPANTGSGYPRYLFGKKKGYPRYQGITEQEVMDCGNITGEHTDGEANEKQTAHRVLV